LKRSKPKKAVKAKSPKALPASQPPAVAPAPALPAPMPSDRLEIRCNGRSEAETFADSGMSPAVLNALVAMNSTRPRMAKSNAAATGIAAYVKVMAAKVQAVADGDMSEIEATCAAQVFSLNAIYADLATRAQENISAGYLEAGETYLRLAFKAQSLCRANAETLGELKNPRPIYAKNFNLANGPQQVNSTTGPQQVNNNGSEPASRACGENNPANKLLGAQ